MLFLASPVLAQPGGPGPHGGRPHVSAHISVGHRPMHQPPLHVYHRPPMPPHHIYRPYHPIVVPHYSSVYYPMTYYIPSTTTTTTYTNSNGVTETVVVKEGSSYEGINTAANVINAAANAATAIRFLTW